MAALLSLLLLLGSLSVQAVSLQSRLRGEAERELQTAEDRLSSAAQLLIARIQLRHACLLPLPLEQWAGAGCASAGELEQLRRGSVLGTAWQLLRWQPEVSSAPAASAASTPATAAPPMSAPPSALQNPTPTGPTPAVSTPSARLALELVLPARERQPARRAGFALQLQGPPWRVIELRPLGLRGNQS